MRERAPGRTVATLTLAAKGLLDRERSATDARANTVRLSAAGREALAGGARPARNCLHLWG